ncbi:MAG: AcrB/AcrD/AcrF family protein [Mucilaginibacter sp.]|nr:AcrB/AcrD/AcrF family protein [Mucilaginibacter sp.]
MFKELWKWLVSAAVISTTCIILVACGEIASHKQPAKQLPRMALPSIQVRALYPGADVMTVLNAVVPPLKDSIFRYARNMDHMSYTASSDGSLIINIYFNPDINMDLAGVNISNIVSITSGLLPSPVVQAGITVDRQYEPLVMAVDLYSEDAGHYNQAFLTNYAATRIIPEIRRVPGISHLITFNGNKDSLMRIFLNKGHMAASNLTLKEALAVVPAKELEAVTEILYKNSKQPFDYIIKCKSEHNQLVKYGNKIIRTNVNTVVRLRDVAAKIEFGPFRYGNFTRINGKPGINIVVMQFADSNYNGIQIAVKKLMETASIKFPAGIKHSILCNPKDSLYISVE